MEMIAKAVRTLNNLTEGKKYKALNGIEEGIFKDKPYVTVVDDYGKKCVCYAYRFEIIKGE